MKKIIIIVILICCIASILYAGDSYVTVNSGAYLTLSSDGDDKTYIINSGDDDGQIIVNSGGYFTSWSPDALIDFSISGDGNITLPVVLSTFTAQFIENTPTIHWSTQSETDNMGWLIYRNNENNFSSSEIISDMIEGHGTTTQQQFYTYEDQLENPEVGDTYYYWLESIDYGGIINHYDNVAILTIPDTHNSGNSGVIVPERFGLFQNVPNPVINSTRISFNLTETGKVDLAIYNLKGQLVKKLYSGITSKHTVMWNGKDEQGKALESGVYLYKLKLDGREFKTKRLILIK